MQPIRLVFFGSSSVAKTVLEQIASASGEGQRPWELAGVVTVPPSPAGRRLKLQPTPVGQLARDRGWDLLEEARPQEHLAWLRDRHADFFLVCAHGTLLTQSVLDVPGHGRCLNLHFSDLPRWRGAAPLERALEAGDTSTAVCLMQMVLDLDAGPIYARTRVRIETTDTRETLEHKLIKASLPLLRTYLPAIQSGRCRPPRPQEGEIRYAHKITSQDRSLDWHRPAEHLAHQIHAMGPSPACWTTLETEHGTVERVKILEAYPTQAHEQNNIENGGVLRASNWRTEVLEAVGRIFLRPEGLVVRCGAPVSDDGAAETSNAPIPEKTASTRTNGIREEARPPGGYDSLCVTRIQRAGRRPMAPAEFFRGFPSPPRRFVQPQGPASRCASSPGGLRENASETPAVEARLTGASAFRQPQRTRQTTSDTSRVRAVEVEAYGGGT